MKKHSTFYDGYIPKFMRICLDRETVKTVLDVGAGDGVFAHAINAHYKGKTYYGIEKSESRFKNHGYAGCCGEFPEVTSELKPYDLVICHHVIEHIEDEAAVLKELKRLTKKYLYIATPYRSRIHMGYYRNAKGERVLDPTHLREYTTKEIVRKIARGMSGFTVSVTPMWFSVLDFILPRISSNQYIYNNPILKLLRNVKLPIAGYYNLEVLAWKD